MNLSLRAGLLCLLLPALALAQAELPAADLPASGPESAAAAPVSSFVMTPGRVHVRGALDAHLLLAAVDVGASAELGLVPMGAGTLALGAGLDYGVCFIFCAISSATRPIGVSESHLTPHARLSYHFGLNDTPALQRMDLYGVVLAGMTWASARFTEDGSTHVVTADDAGLMVGVGMGASYFLQENFFAGLETRLHFSQGRYVLPGQVGNTPLRQSDSSWSTNGASLVFFAGLRL
jgi:hypothetical protein